MCPSVQSSVVMRITDRTDVTQRLCHLILDIRDKILPNKPAPCNLCFQTKYMMYAIVFANSLYKKTTFTAFPRISQNFEKKKCSKRLG